MESNKLFSLLEELENNSVYRRERNIFLPINGCWDSSCVSPFLCIRGPPIAIRFQREKYALDMSRANVSRPATRPQHGGCWRANCRSDVELLHKKRRFFFFHFGKVDDVSKEKVLLSTTRPTIESKSFTPSLVFSHSHSFLFIIPLPFLFEYHSHRGAPPTTSPFRVNFQVQLGPNVCRSDCFKVNGTRNKCTSHLANK